MPGSQGVKHIHHAGSHPVRKKRSTLLLLLLWAGANGTLTPVCAPPSSSFQIEETGLHLFPALFLKKPITNGNGSDVYVQEPLSGRFLTFSRSNRCFSLNSFSFVTFRSSLNTVMLNHDHHPLLNAVQACIESKEGAEAIQAIIDLNTVCSVATYILSHDGKALWLHKPGKGKHSKKTQSFWGMRLPQQSSHQTKFNKARTHG